MTLYDAVDTLDIEAIVKYVAGLQRDDGSFTGDKWGEIDTRFSFCAVACLSLLVSSDSVCNIYCLSITVFLVCGLSYDIEYQ